MRAAVVALVLIFGLMSVPGLLMAAPAAPHELAGPAPALWQARGGCGIGWHPQSWRDRWGNWHRRCVPNRW